MEIVKLKLKDIKPYAKNARKNDKAVNAVMESIKQCEYIAPIILDEDYVILAGHTRYKALKKLGYTEIECVIKSGLTDEQKKKYRLLDNKTAEIAEWDFDILSEELDGLDFGDLELDWGISTDESQVEITEDEVPEVDEQAEPICKLGDIWQLGEHRLICGDSTDKATIEKLMNGEKADMVFTDPPYGINVVKENKVGADFGIAKKGQYEEVIADNSTETAKKAYEITKNLSKKQIIWGGNYFLDFLPFSDSYIIWDKRVDSGIRNTFADGEMAWCSFHTPIRIYHQLWNGMIREGEKDTRVHPTQKPIRMLSEIIKDFSVEKELILDVFGGSGSTLIACEQLNRKCYMCELSPKYCDVIIKRWETLTGKKAVKIN